MKVPGVEAFKAKDDPSLGEALLTFVVAAILFVIVAICVVIISALLIGTTALLKGFVITKLWGWFVVPAFGVAAISLPVAIGLGVLLSFMTCTYMSGMIVRKEDWLKNTLMLMYTHPIIVLFTGWIVQMFL